MKKNIVKVISLILVVALVCACSASAFAAGFNKDAFKQGAFNFVKSIVTAATDPSYDDAIDSTTDAAGDSYEDLVDGYVGSVIENGGAQASTDFVDTAVTIGVNYLKGILGDTGFKF